MTPQEAYKATIAAKSKGKGNTGLTADTTFGVAPKARAKQMPTPDTGVTKTRDGNLKRAADFGTAVAKSTGRFVAGAGRLVGNVAADTYKGVVDFADPVAKVATGWYEQDQKQVDELNRFNEARLDKVLTDYKAGALTKSQYQLQLKDIAEERQRITAQVEKNMKVIDSDRKRVAEGAVSTAITIVSAGSYASVATSARGSKFLVGKGVTNRVLATKIGPAIVKAEKLAAKVPSVQALMARNGAKFANTSRGVINQSIRDAAVGVLFKSPFLYHGTVDDVRAIYKDIDESNIGAGTIARVAFVVTNAFDGGILGASGKFWSKASQATKLATLGRGSMLDDLCKRFADGDARAWVGWINDAVDEADRAKRVDSLKSFQEMNLNKWGSSGEAVEAIAYHVSTSEARDISKLNFGSDFMDQQVKYLDNFKQIDDLAAAGKIVDENGVAFKRGDLALGTFGRGARAELIEALKGKSYIDQVKYIEDLVNENVYYVQNPIMKDRLLKIIHDAATGKADLEKTMMAINTGEDLSKYLPKKLAEQMGKDGYILTAPVRNTTKFIDPEDARALITNEIVTGVETLKTVDPVPALNNFHGLLTKAGLSTQAANDVAYKHLYSSVTSQINDLPIMAQIVDENAVKFHDTSKAGQFVLGALQDYAENKLPLFGGKISKVNAISDIRQLRYGEIVEAMGQRGIYITRNQAKQISNAIVDGYKELPLALRGAGDRFVDNMFKYVPGYRTYNRAQSALRYTYNPFFRTQERVETAILSRATAGNLIWGKGRAQLDDTVKQLEAARLFNTGFSGEGARDDVVLGRITANMSKGQKRDLAGLALKIADKKGVPIETMVADHLDELEDALKVIVQYPSKGIVSSPLARTINLAFFPMRYNAKVSIMAAKILAKQPPLVQYSVINGLMDANKWLQSDEGVYWQSENSEALGLLKWLTPYGSIQSTINLLNGSTDSISSLGVLGGLPVGVVFQILDSQGAFQNLPGGLKYQTPYVDPKTGEVYADKIPVTLKARTAVALGDFINSVFTYPGRVVGLPGKGEAIRTSVGVILDTDSNEYKYLDQESKLTELQRRQSELLKNKALDEMDHDELLTVFQTNGQWSTPNIAALIASPKPEVRQPEEKVELGRTL